MNSQSQRNPTFTACARERTTEVPSRRDDLNANPTAVTVPTMKTVIAASNNHTGKFANSATTPTTPPAMVSHMAASSALRDAEPLVFSMSLIVLTHYHLALTATIGDILPRG